MKVYGKNRPLRHSKVSCTLQLLFTYAAQKKTKTVQTQKVIQIIDIAYISTRFDALIY